MAQVVKAKEKKEIINLDKEKEKNKSKSKIKESSNKKNNKNKIPKEEKNGLWTKFMIFCHGIKSEVLKVRWTSKKDMLKYSIATIVFIIFCSLFFYGIDAIFALVQSLVKGR